MCYHFAIMTDSEMKKSWRATGIAMSDQQKLLVMGWLILSCKGYLSIKRVMRRSRRLVLHSKIGLLEESMMSFGKIQSQL